MESQKKLVKKTRVIKVGSEELWDYYVKKSSNQGWPVVASMLEIKAMPTFLLMKNGAPCCKLVGANPVELRKRIKAFIYG